MSEAFLSSWPFDPALAAGLLVLAFIYFRGWRTLRCRDPRRWKRRQPLAFLAGLATLYLALASPLEPFSYFFLQIHMAQHLLLTMAAPPLLWLGEPAFPLLRGLPEPIRTYWAAPLMRRRGLRTTFSILTHPVAALILFTGVNWLWHLPALYELALRADEWHYLQHASFLAAALLFWHPIVRPYPSRPRWSKWLLFPCLVVADLQNTLLSALLTFVDRPLYLHYAAAPRLAGGTALEDQAAAGVMMWVLGSIAFLAPLFWLAAQALFGVSNTRAKRALPARISLPMARKASPGFDLLEVPVLGIFLRWRHARLALQLPMLLLAGVVIYDGLAGPETAPMNLAGVLPWIHWRGLLIFAMLAIGNVFCLACPFMAPRTLARRLRQPSRDWPRWLRSKWLALVLVGFFLWAYEAFALWDSPWLTAWLALAYFLAAFVVDCIFRGATFCKHVCPIGQFNFVQSLAAPFEVKARDLETCAGCPTKDCIRGRTESAVQPAVRGCELGLFLPRKAGNTDCTLCLDCVHACPHENIGLAAGVPVHELWSDRHRSGVGRFSRRPDMAAMVLLLTFGAFANAAGMVGPALEAEDRLSRAWGQTSPFWAVTCFYLLALAVLPAALTFSAAAASTRLSGSIRGLRETWTRFAFAFVPLGFSMWLAHYGFHLLTSFDAALPAAQRFLHDLGGIGGVPDWTASCCRPVGPWLPKLEIFFLDLGLLLSLYVGFRIARGLTPNLGRAYLGLAPWALLLVSLFALGVWIVLQPMQMRGTLSMGG